MLQKATTDSSHVTGIAERSGAPSGLLHFLAFEFLMLFVAIASYFVVRRRKRTLELRAQMRYDRLSRVEVGQELGETGPSRRPSTTEPEGEQR